MQIYGILKLFLSKKIQDPGSLNIERKKNSSFDFRFRFRFPFPIRFPDFRISGFRICPFRISDFRISGFRISDFGFAQRKLFFAKKGPSRAFRPRKVESNVESNVNSKQKIFKMAVSCIYIVFLGLTTVLADNMFAFVFLFFSPSFYFGAEYYSPVSILLVF